MPGDSTDTETDAGLALEPAATFRIDTVPPHSRAARAGVKAGDILRRINRLEPRSRAQAERAMKSAASKPMLLEIQRDQRRIAIVVPGGAAR